MSDIFAEDDYYLLLLVDELKQKDENLITCFDLFSRLRQEGKRIWVNCRGRKGELNNSYFIPAGDLNAKWNYFIVTEYIERGFYDKYYIVDCMFAPWFQRHQIECKLIAAEMLKQRQEQQRKEKAARRLGKQYNMFGGLD